MDKNKKISVLAAALVSLIAVGGLAYGSFAQDSGSSAPPEAGAPAFGQENSQRMGMRFGGLSEEDKAQFEARRAEREAKREAAGSALEAGDYQAWVDAHDADDPVLEKINEKNFSKLMQAHDHFASGRALMEELGIEKGLGKGLGKGGFGGGCRMAR